MFYESIIEKSIIELLTNLGYEYFDDEYPWVRDRQLDSFIIEEILIEQLLKINHTTDVNLAKEAINKLTRVSHPSLVERNRQIGKMLVDGVDIDSKDYRVNPHINFIDFENPENNLFQVTHQVKFNEGRNTRIPDVLVFEIIQAHILVFSSR